ncbi:MAG TPA: fluoride efflux transporter CrcB [Rhodothermales bacterium]|nr:fluoride efflux transporter CrcB [Rhodothermales bacterium]
MLKFVYIAIGGAMGSVLRYLVSGWVYRVTSETFPWGTLAVNIAGCFVIGFLWALAERVVFSAGARAFVFTGVLGGFTTFSTFGLETFNLLRDGEAGYGLGNVVGSTVAGIAAVFAGFAACRLLLGIISAGEAT